MYEIYDWKSLWGKYLSNSTGKMCVQKKKKKNNHIIIKLTLSLFYLTY